MALVSRPLAVTRADVARQAGVSTAVVSYVINEGPRNVAAPTRERVLEAIRELGYRPNVVAQALKTRRTKTIGLLVPDSANPYFAELARAIEDAASNHDYALLLANSANDRAREVAQVNALRDRQVDGLLLISTSSGLEFDSLMGGNTPIVLLDRAAPAVNFPSVVVDNRRGAYLGVSHLIQHQHRQIACLAGPSTVEAAVDRRRGWQQALEAADLCPDGLLYESDFSREGGYEAARGEILTKANQPTAVFVSSDLQSTGVLRACYELRIRVPEDLAVVSFDGTVASKFTTPPLTAVQQDITEMASAALRLVLAEPRAKPDLMTPPQEMVPSSLVIRQSCGCAAG